MVTTRLPAAIASSCIARLLAKLASPTCAMLAPGKPSSISARTGLPLLKPASRSRMSKWASSVISPISSSDPPIPSTPGRVTALLPPTSKVSACASALAATASRSTGVACSMVRPARSDVAAVENHGFDLAAGLDIVPADPAQSVCAASPAQDRSAPGVTEPAASGAPSSPTGASPCAVETSSERLGQPAIALTVASPLA